MKNEKKPSPGLTVAAVVFGFVDVAALALLVASVVISPAKSEPVQAKLPADYQENYQEYYDADMTQEYASDASVVYRGGVVAEKKEETAETAGTADTTAESDTIDTSEDPYAGFVFPDSDTTVITKAQMKKTLTDKSLCRRAINEIYARHGYQFSKQENTDYFNQYDWYRTMPKETDMSAVAASFTSAEKKNVEALQAYEDSKGWN